MTGPSARSGVAAAPGVWLAAAAAPALVGFVALGLARSILLPSQGFWDTGEFQSVPPVLGTAHPTGYPSYVILGWLATIALTPLGEAALRMNLLSALLLAVAAGLTVVLVRQLSGRTSVAIGAGLLLALTPIPWRMGGFADPHTLHLALMAGLLVLLVGWERSRDAGSPRADRWLVAAAALYGVMLGNHTLTILLALGIALFVLAVEPGILRRPHLVARCVGALVGTTVILYLELPIRAAMGAPLVYGHPDTWDGFWYVVLGEQFRGDLAGPLRRSRAQGRRSREDRRATSSASSRWPCPRRSCWRPCGAPGSSSSPARGWPSSAGSPPRTRMPRSTATTWGPCSS